MPLSEIDRNLLERCLASKPLAWEDFVDRFMGLVTHVINHAAETRSIRLSAADREDLAAEVFLALLQDDYAALRRFRGLSSLATYITVIARRVVVRQLVSTITNPAHGGEQATSVSSLIDPSRRSSPTHRVSDMDQVRRLLTRLDGVEAQAMQMFHLEGRSYEEIGHSLGMPENSVGPMLSRARTKLRRPGDDNQPAA
ncbi:RNA polymerase sigma factor RpoE [Pseudobythopirellula maris]|uniref:RNA polymerase sigma factor RpoE n=1 Tax=Pseudobythopirellula maris TaxID=2527991 RepID=A0A5C5ZHU8_9BACT|nr:sigma-70 family RNA polymerase sigma factor [Pseudobythopirellula maris]TWT86758.1 RNA polymerase sigma factor RpoE [Pseudobythopirellula maris]